MLEVLTGFVGELRRAGIPVSVTEVGDAAEAICHVRLDSRETLRHVLAATLVKSSAHEKAFETAFEVYFSMRGPQYALSAPDASVGDGETTRGELVGGNGGGELTDEEFIATLYHALAEGDSASITVLARLAVARFAAMEPGRPVGGTYYLYRTLRHLDVDGLLARLLDDGGTNPSPGPFHDEATARRPREGGAPRASGLESRLRLDEYASRIEELRREIEAEIRRRLVADRGAEALAASLRSPLPEDVDFMHASRVELVAMGRAIQPIARKLQARLGRRRRHLRQGPLDFRATVRHSLSTGGVPLEPRFRRPRPSKPEIFVIADISGSVAAFARFTLHLVHAIAAEFSQVRTFVFIDGLDEVTSIFERSESVAEAVARVSREADVIWIDGHSDYGHALVVFYERFWRDVSAKTSIIVLGDGRSNYHAPEAWVLCELHRRARRLYWLNPEHRAYWGSGDSVIGEYLPFTDGVFECRNLRQLEAFVEQLA